LGAQGPAARAYRQAQLKACRAWSLEGVAQSLPGSASRRELLDLLENLAHDEAVDAILLELPLPPGLPPSEALCALPPEKDVEGVTPVRYGRLFLAKAYSELESLNLIAPPTALAIAELLRETRLPLAGKRAVVVGRSGIVGRPAAHLLTALDLTVTLCHSRTRDLEGEIRRADIVVAAIGRAGLIRGSWLKRGAVVIDAGVSEQEGRICGDVDFQEARKTAATLTPVPGGVGPVTIAMLLANAVRLAEARLRAG